MNLKQKILLGLIWIFTAIPQVMAGTLPVRPNWTTTITQVPNPRLPIINNLWGGYNTTVDAPNFGMLIWNSLMVYQDSIGQVAWVIMFSLPFLMMWIVQSDMTLAAIVGMLFSLYVFLKLPQEYIVFSVGAFCICIAALLWSLYKRAY